jgi:hypothetical protein
MRPDLPVAEPNLELVDPSPTSFHSTEASEDGLTLRIEFLEGVAGQLHHVEAAEDAEQVAITVFLGMTPEAAEFAAGGGMFTMQGFPKVAEVRLRRPLGDRLVVDQGRRLQN